MQIQLRPDRGRRLRYAGHGQNAGQGLLLLCQRRSEGADRQVCRQLHATWWWTTKLGWSISAAARFRTWIPCFSWSATAPAGAFRPWARIAEMVGELESEARRDEADRQPRAERRARAPASCEEIEQARSPAGSAFCPQDETVYEADCDGKPSAHVPDDCSGQGCAAPPSCRKSICKLIILL